RAAVLKYDSWAATALYPNSDSHAVVCKFNRVHRLLLLPTAWMGRWLARRDEKVLRVVVGVAGVPRWAGRSHADGRPCLHAVAHDWIEGETFKPWRQVDEAFFPE